MKIQSVVLAAALLSPLAAFADKTTMEADKAAVSAACATDAKTANCSDKKVGTGLLRCLHDHKKAHKEFKLSAGCKTAINQHRADKKEKKADKK